MPTSRAGASPQEGGPFEDVAAAATCLGREMRNCLSAILATNPSVRTFAATLGLDKSLGWQVHTIATASEAIPILTALPGPAGMSNAMRALDRLGIDTMALDRARLALNGTLRARGISRTQLKSMATGHSGGEADVRGLQSIHRRAFQASAAIRGMFTKGTAVAVMLAPGPNASSLCMVASTMLHRVTRTRPSGLMPIYFVTRVSRSGGKAADVADPHAQSPSHAALMRQFSSSSVTPDMLHVCEFKQGEALCLDAAHTNLDPVDLAFRQVIHGVRAAPSAKTRAADVDVYAPTEHLVVDLMLHQSLGASVPLCALYLRAAPEGVHRGFPDFMRHPIAIDSRWIADPNIHASLASAGARWDGLIADGAAVAGAALSDFRIFRTCLRYPPTPSTLRVTWS